MNQIEKSPGIFQAMELLLFMALVLLIYSNTFNSPFIFDDFANIRDNSNIRLTRLTMEGIKNAGPVNNRPVANISFALNYFFSRYNTVGYHLTNILIHIASGILLYFFVKTTLSIPSLQSKYGSYKWIPFFTAIIWLVHPIQIQSVTYIVQRMNSMAAMFYIMSLLLYARARLSNKKITRWIFFAGCILSGILALGSKEIAATLPFFILLYEWYFFQELRKSWLKRSIPVFVVIFGLFVILLFIYLGNNPLEKLSADYAKRDFTLTQRVLTEFRVVLFYITLLILPHPSRLNLLHDFPLPQALIDPITSTLLSIGAILGLIVLAFNIARKERLLSFCIFWFLGNLIIESSVIKLELIYEHRNYLPSMMVSLMLVALTYRRIKAKWLTVAVLCLVVTVFSIWTYKRNGVWRDNLALWSDCVEKSPKLSKPHYNLGVTLFLQGNIDDAIKHFREAIRIKPDYVKAHSNLGFALEQKGDLDGAKRHYSEALRIKPDIVQTYNTLGKALLHQGRLDEAISRFNKAIEIDKNYWQAYNSLGIAFMRQNRFNEAISSFSEAIKIDPKCSKAYNNMGIALIRQVKLEEAVSQFSMALKINPNYTIARRNLEFVKRRIEEPVGSSRLYMYNRSYHGEK